MSNPQPFYDNDLAYIHDVGFSSLCQGWIPGLMETLKTAKIKKGQVVDVGCGGGIWAEALNNADYQVTGVDISPAMIDVARRRVPTAEFHIGSIWSYDLPKCRVVTALSEVVCYVSDGQQEHNLGEFFKKVFSTLTPGGLLIFDVAEVGLEQECDIKFAEGDDWACLVKFDYDESLRRLTRNITAFRQIGELFRRTQERHVVQLYHAEEVASLLRSSGFLARRVRKFGDYPLLPHRIGFVACKP